MPNRPTPKPRKPSVTINNSPIPVSEQLYVPPLSGQHASSTISDDELLSLTQTQFFTKPQFALAFIEVLEAQFSHCSIFHRKLSLNLDNNRLGVVQHIRGFISYDVFDYDEFFEFINKNPESDIFLIPLGLSSNVLQFSHANVLVIDVIKHTCSHFDPHGSITLMWEPVVHAHLEIFCANIGCLYETPRMICPNTPKGRIGPQALLNRQPSTKTHLHGTCAVWSLWFIYLRVKYPEPSAAELLQYAIDGFYQGDEGLDSLGVFIEKFIIGILKSLDLSKHKHSKLLTDNALAKKFAEQVGIKGVDPSDSEIDALLHKPLELIRNGTTYEFPLVHHFLKEHYHLPVNYQYALSLAVKDLILNPELTVVTFRDDMSTADIDSYHIWRERFIEYAKKKLMKYEHIKVDVNCYCSRTRVNIGCVVDNEKYVPPITKNLLDDINKVSLKTNEDRRDFKCPFRT